MNMHLKPGDYIQYWTAQGEDLGRALVVRQTEYWIIILSQRTGKQIHWSEDLMRRVPVRLR